METHIDINFAQKYPNVASLKTFLPSRNSANHYTAIPRTPGFHGFWYETKKIQAMHKKTL